MKFKKKRKRTQVIRSNSSSMDDVLNTQQTQIDFSTVILKNQSYKKGNNVKGALCYVEKE